MKFSILKFPVTISSTFLIIILFFLRRDLEAKLYSDFLLKAFVILTSILVHEIGHGLLFRRYKIKSRIVLHGFGGVCVPEGGSLKETQSILVSLAGPFSSLLLSLLFYILWKQTPEDGSQLNQILFFAFAINLFWGIFNLIPLQPMDGGQAFLSTLKTFNVKYSEEISYSLSFILLIGFGAWALYVGLVWNIILVGWFGYENYMLWKRHIKRKLAEKVTHLTYNWTVTQDNENLQKLLSIAEKTKEKDIRADALLSSAVLFSFLGNWARASDAFTLSGSDNPIMKAIFEKHKDGIELPEIINSTSELAEGVFEKLYLIRLVLYNLKGVEAVKFTERICPYIEEDKKIYEWVSTDMHYGKEYESSIVIGKLLFEKFNNGRDAYNIACSYSCLNDAKQALRYLEMAWEAGYQDVKTLKEDSDFDNIRDSIEFKGFLKRMNALD